MQGLKPRITFGIIVLNGQPFVRYNLRAIYPFAHQIIVVEGAAPAASGVAGPDGHSTDGTLDVVRAFIAEEDPERKLILVTAEDEGHADGFWPGEKHEQSRAYASRATGDYLWQIDIDEFYLPEDMQRVATLLAADPGITQMTFRQITFWGGFDCTCDGWFLRRGAQMYHRLFKWGPGYEYRTHRPPTVVDAHGRDVRSLKWLDGGSTSAMGIAMRHYSLVFPKQVREKCAYYRGMNPAWAGEAETWAREVYFGLRRRYRVHNVYLFPSWLERYAGRHPPQVEAMREDLRAGRLVHETRSGEDVERLLASPWYGLGRAVLKAWEPWDRCLRPWYQAAARRAVRLARLGRGGQDRGESHV